MRRLLALCAAICALASTASPLLAAGEAPSPELDRFYLRLASGPREVSRMVGCLLNQNPDTARKLFDDPLFSEPYSRTADEFLRHGSNCLFNNSDLRMSSLLFVGTVAEQLIERDRPARPGRAAWPDGSSLQLGGGKHLWTWRNLTPAATGRMLPLSYCLLERHPDQVEAIFATRPTSDGERKLFNAMNDEIDTCIPSGETWTLQPHLLRAALAVAYYRSARAAGLNVNSGAAD